MTYSSEITADSPVLWWRLGESSGTTASDSSGNSRAGTYTGGVTLGASPVIAPETDTSASFDGVDDYVTYAGSVLSAAPNFTAEIWINTTSTAASTIIRMSGTSSSLDISLSATGFLGVTLNATGTGIYGSGDITANFRDGKRHHVAVTFASPNITVYFDGVSVATGSTSGNFNATTTFIACTSGPTSFYNGRLDEFAVYSTALSSTRIKAHYDAGNPATQTISPGFLSGASQAYGPTITLATPPALPDFLAGTSQVFGPRPFEPRNVSASARIVAPRRTAAAAHARLSARIEAR